MNVRSVNLRGIGISIVLFGTLALLSYPTILQAIDITVTACVGNSNCNSNINNSNGNTNNNSNTNTNTNSGGGGGGGGGGAILPSFPPVSVTNVIFKGRAYPGSSVTLLKDAQVAASTVAGSDAFFQATLSGLTAGSYIFSLYSEDSAARRSSLLTFPVSVTAGATTTVSGIFISPTIAVDKDEVKKGDNIAIFGQTSPSSEVTISVSSEEQFVKTQSDTIGAYLYNFDTSALEFGQHHTKSKSAVNGEISSFGTAVAFQVGEKTIKKEKENNLIEAQEVDINHDERVNLVDFSIMAYWYKRPSPPVGVDLNHDNKVNLVDFSIMAYYWTG